MLAANVFYDVESEEEELGNATSVLQCGIIDALRRAERNETIFAPLIRTHFSMRRTEIEAQINQWRGTGAVPSNLAIEALKLLANY